ncbi:MAG: AAA family ATPase [Planctomycetota bacterium]|nr:MAG: AAA family ATPase [Planctomycetota bacterium]
MTWQGIEGHDEVAQRFCRALARGRLASTFLFIGPAGVGKRTFAEKLAQALLCPHVDEAELAPCGRCDSCVQAASHTHPDLLIVEKPPEKSFIPVSAFIGEDQRRMREGLCHDIAMKPFMGGRKVAIIDDADYLNEEGANALLKTLEEPPPRSVLILIGTSAERQLPTIRSRAQMIRFAGLPDATLAEILLARELATDRDQAQRMASFAGGSLQRAVELADESLWAFRGELLVGLSAPVLDSVAVAGQLVPFVDAAGKEASARRARARQVVAFAVEFYRQLVHALCGATTVGDAELLRAVEQCATHWRGDLETATACIDRSLETLAHIDRNAHLATALECWLNDLAEIIVTGHGVATYGNY